MKNERKKIKSLVMICVMLLSAMTAIVVLQNQIVKATPTAFTISTPADGTGYDRKVTTSVNITWTASNATQAPTYYTNYTISIGGVQKQNNSKRYYNWDITSCKGNYTISVSAWNSSTIAPKRKFATNNNITVHVFLSIPGFDNWGNATNSKLITYDAVGDTTAITINTTGLSANTYYYLYRPYYNYSGTSPNTFQWGNIIWDGDQYIRIKTDATDPTWKTATFPAYRLDTTGPWAIATEQSNPTWYTIAAFVWVNSSTAYSITDPGDETAFGTNGTLPITINTGTESHSYWDLFYNNAIVTNNKGVRFHYDYTNLNSIGLYGNITKGVGTGAGNYTIKAYKDVDPGHVYDWQDWGYNTTHGSSWTGVTGYDYKKVGPWDPPERNATDVTFRVTPGTFQIALAETNKTMYWNFAGRMDISIKDSSGTPINATGFNILNGTGQNISSHLTVHRAVGWINISNSTTGAGGRWGTPGTTWGENDSLAVYMWVDRNGDRTEGNKDWTEEWNGSVDDIQIASAPGTQFKWVDDDGTYFTGADTDGVIPSIPPIASVPLAIKFQIIGDDHTYFGGTTATQKQQAMENMTLTGNAIFTGTFDKIPGVSFVAGTGIWTVPVIPTMSQYGGSIRLDYTWKTASKNYGTGYAIDAIGGTKYYTNGTVVTVDTSEFYIDTAQTFTLTVEDGDGNSNKYGTAYLYYIGDTDGGTLGDPIQAHMISIDDGYNGYTLGFNTTQQRTNQTTAGFTTIRAPRNLTAYVVAYVGSVPTYGYALIKMKPKNAFKVHAEAIGALTTLMSGYEYSKFYINTTIAGINTTPTADSGDMVVRIIDESGNDVTNSLGTPTAWDPFAGQIDDDYTVVLTDAYFTEPGNYTVYAYNNTATSEGNNGSLVIKQVAVATTFAGDVSGDFIWKHDDNISATFTITYAGQAANLSGTLRIDNISDANTKYNRTWANTSFDGSSDHGGTLGNTSIEVDIVDGVITVNEITADYLPSGVADKDITFWFKPTGGVYARASGVVKVRVPTVVSDVYYIPVLEKTKVGITVYGRNNEKLQGVYVGLHGTPIYPAQNGTSGSNGKVIFSVTPGATGNISIDVGEAGRTVETNIQVVDWTLVVTTDPLTQVNELEDFTVTVTDKDTGFAVEGADVTFNGLTPTTDSTGMVTFTAPAVTSDSTLGITVTAVGYPAATTSIKVIYVPALIISSDTSVVAGATFDVAVAKDTGDAVIGATVTFDGKTYKTKAGGVVTLTAPTTVGDYDITATFGTFTPVTTTITVTKKTGGIPGFELVTLIAAIGVALILLRRRRN